METTFNFSNRNTEFIYALHPKSQIILHIKRKNNKVARLYFTNQLNEKIDIPPEFVIYQNSNIKNPNETDETDEYTLYWNKNYDVVFNGVTLYNIRNERTWTIYN
jgi:hypothetical protein